MKIIKNDAIKVVPETINGTKKIEITLDLTFVKEKSGDRLSEKIFQASKDFTNEFLSGIYSSIAESIADLENSKDKEANIFLTCLETSASCSYVYWGCGSCSGGRARVDAYCGSGGSQPDYSWCESC